MVTVTSVYGLFVLKILIFFLGRVEIYDSSPLAMRSGVKM